METKNQGFVVITRWTLPELIILLATGCYLAVLPMADTIALRNLALLTLLLALTWKFPVIRPDIRWRWPVLLWAIYLLCFPLIAIDRETAISSFLGQWGKGLLAMVAGAGVAAVLVRRRWDGLFFLGLVSAVPLLVFLVLFVSRAISIGAIPWGYWGRETHHADLGYAAGHVVILMTSAWLGGQRPRRLWALGFVLLALACTVMARSRAGLVFALMGSLLVFLFSYLASSSQRQRHWLGAAILVVLLAGGALAFALKDDPRWSRMTNELKAGFLGNALTIECEGTTSIDAALANLYGESNQQAMAASVSYGDGSRMMVARAGLALAAQHPWGSDGSRQAFQRLLRQACAAEPALKMAHTHNGWLDTLLAIGWLGAALYLGVLLAFAYTGLQGLRVAGASQPWALVLTVSAIFWLLRGFTDSVFRDHMLEMQGFLLAFSATMLRLGMKYSDTTE